MFQITGTLKSKQAEQQVSDKFRKREFAIPSNAIISAHTRSLLLNRRRKCR